MDARHEPAQHSYRSSAAGGVRPGEHRRASRWWGRLPSTSVRVVAWYAVVSLLWIAFSDAVLVRAFPDAAALGAVQTVKGAAFVVVTSALLYVLVRRGERGLRSLSAEVRATVDSMLDGVLLVDSEHRVVEANRAAVELFGVRSKDDLLGPLPEWGRRFRLRYLDGTPVPAERYAATRALAGQKVRSYDAILRRADGREVFVNVSAAPVSGARQGALAVTVLRDISAARRLDEIRDEFLSTAAHEFKTPLAVVKAYAQLMQKREPQEAQALAVIQRQVERLNRLVQHLLDTSRLRLDGDGRRERFDVGVLATEVADGMRPSAPAHDLRVDVAEGTFVVAERERIARVVTSLLDNAVRFSPRGGTIAVVVTARDSIAVVSVEDHGLGIPEERQHHVFERFYRAHAGTSHDYGGLGLGLEMSREIVLRHGGEMWFESAPGKGSTFHFSLPLAREEASA